MRTYSDAAMTATARCTTIVTSTPAAGRTPTSNRTSARVASRKHGIETRPARAGLAASTSCLERQTSDEEASGTKEPSFKRKPSGESSAPARTSPVMQSSVRIGRGPQQRPSRVFAHLAP